MNMTTELKDAQTRLNRINSGKSQPGDLTWMTQNRELVTKIMNERSTSFRLSELLSEEARQKLSK